MLHLNRISNLRVLLNILQCLRKLLDLTASVGRISELQLTELVTHLSEPILVALIWCNLTQCTTRVIFSQFIHSLDTSTLILIPSGLFGI